MTTTHEIALNAEKQAETAHILIAEHGGQLTELWKINRKHDRMLANHDAVMKCISKSVDGLSQSISLNSTATSSNTSTLRDFKVMARTVIFMGAGFIVMVSGFIAFVVFVCSKLMHWW